MNSLKLEEPSRQSPIGVAVIFFKNMRIALNILLSIVAVSVGFKTSFLGMDIYTIGIGVIALFFVISILQYRRFYFYVENNNFIIEKGLLSKEKITVPFDRIQTVNIKQNLIQQLLGVVALNIDTAGSAKKELEISALPGKYARELQRYLVSQKEKHTEDKDKNASLETLEVKTEQPTWDVSEDKPLVKLGIADLFKIGLTENHLRTGLVIFAILNGYLWQYEEYLLKPFEPFLEEQADFFFAEYMIIVPIAFILFIIISVLISLIQTVLKYFELKFFVNAKGVQLVSGLLKRMEYQIPVNKIQYLKWKSNPLRKLIGLQTLVVKQATSNELGDKQSVKVPGCHKHQLHSVLDEFYPERSTGEFLEIEPRNLLALQLGTWLGLLPALAMCGLAFIDWKFIAVPILYIIPSLFFILKYYRSVKLNVNREMLFLTKGWVFPSTLALKFYKMQNVTLSQSIFQKRRGLASITFYTAAGDESMPHLPIKEAQEIYNYVLYKIQSDGRSWM